MKTLTLDKLNCNPDLTWSLMWTFILVAFAAAPLDHAHGRTHRNVVGARRHHCLLYLTRTNVLQALAREEILACLGLLAACSFSFSLPMIKARAWREMEAQHCDDGGTTHGPGDVGFHCPIGPWGSTCQAGDNNGWNGCGGKAGVPWKDGARGWTEVEFSEIAECVRQR